jgi:hypothetical protein
VTARQAVPRFVDGLSVTVQTHARVEVGALFDTVVAEDVLPHVLHRYRFIPGVTGTDDLSGPWDTPGSTRTVHLADGGHARERIDEYRRPHSFAYTVSDFSGAFGRLVDHAVGAWQFRPDGDGSRFTWTYRFVARPGRGPIVAVVVRTGWAGYMHRAAQRCARRAETHRS